MSIATSIHETSTTGGTGTLTLTASSTNGELRVSDAYAVDDPVQYRLQSTTTDKWEEGIGKVGASNTLARTLPTRTWNGTTLDKSPASALDFSTETVDVYVTPITGGVAQLLPQVADVGVKALPSAHVGDGADNQTKSVLANRVFAVPYLPPYAGEVDGIREEITSAAGTKYRLAIRTSNPTTGLPDTELWQSGDITPAASITSTAISPVINIDGNPLWILVLIDTTSTWRAFNRASAGPTQAGFASGNMRCAQSLFDDISSGWSSIPASGSLTWGVDEGSAVGFALEYA